MRFRLRTLLIVLALGPPVLGWTAPLAVWLLRAAWTAQPRAIRLVVKPTPYDPNILPPGAVDPLSP